MPLTPLDIHNKEFRKSFRGYDEEEVDEFLDAIIESYEALYKENLSLKEQVANKESNISHYKDLEETLKQTLVVAQQTADEIKHNSAKEAEVIIKEAEFKASQIIGQAEEKARRAVIEADEKAHDIKKEFEDLKKQVQVFKVKFKSFLASQMSLIEDEDHELFGDTGVLAVIDEKQSVEVPKLQFDNTIVAKPEVKQEPVLDMSQLDKTDLGYLNIKPDNSLFMANKEVAVTLTDNDDDKKDEGGLF